MERVDPIELRAGITQGMVYVEAAMARGLRGLYLVRAVAIQQVRPGDQPVRVQMLRGGVVMAEEIGVAQVWSLRVPSPRTGAQAELSVGFDLRGNGETVRTNCWTCPNGVTICVEKPICGVDGLLPGKC